MGGEVRRRPGEARGAAPPALPEGGQEAREEGDEVAEEVRDKGEAESDEDDAAHDLDDAKRSADLPRRGEERVHAERGEEEGHGESERVDAEEENAGPGLPRRARVEKDRGQDRPDAGGPPGGEGDPDEDRPEESERPRGHAELGLARERGNREESRQVEPEEDDEDAARLAEDLPGRGGGRAERDEDHREAEDERERVEDGEAADPARLVLGRQLVERHPRDEGDVGRHEREDAGRGERDEPRQERREEGNLARLRFEHQEVAARRGAIVSSKTSGGV